MMGHEALWHNKKERDAIYVNPDATEANYMHAAELESRFIGIEGYSSEAGAGELLLSVGILLLQHKNPMRSVEPGYRLRILLVQALSSDPDILLMNELTTQRDMESIESLNNALEKYTGTLIFVFHDREFVSSLASRILEFNPNGITDLMAIMNIISIKQHVV